MKYDYERLMNEAKAVIDEGFTLTEAEAVAFEEATDGFMRLWELNVKHHLNSIRKDLSECPETADPGYLLSVHERDVKTACEVLTVFRALLAMGLRPSGDGKILMEAGAWAFERLSSESDESSLPFDPSVFEWFELSAFHPDELKNDIRFSPDDLSVYEFQDR